MSRSVRPYSLSPLAETDLEEIWLYTFKHWSPQQADRYHHQIIATIEGLAAGVKAGRPATVREGYFKYPVGSHVVFYRQSDSNFDVIRILHRRMDVAAHLQE
ncbi:MAG TPA: type II toxin-antitoxin system RelE/ParE family toxin [Acetobacteraceae bacterium]|nr:type II toxin-antitoxin system RelE/ParE family toxin [Acetobacteraceae bacterium]